MPMPTRRLGRNGPQVCSIGLGLMILAGAYGARDTEEYKQAFLDRAYEIGARFWDTSDVYGDSEDVVGRWFAANPSKRGDVFLGTKFGFVVNGEDRTRPTENSTPEHVKEACERSLKRLQTDYIDLYYCHRVDRKTPIERTVEAMVELKREGKIHHLGLSEISAKTLTRAHAVHPIAAAQMEYSPFELGVETAETNFLSTARSLGVSIVAYAPIGRGFFSGQLKSTADLPPDDFRRMVTKFGEANWPKINWLVDVIRAVAARKGVSVAQATLAWLLGLGDDIIPIPGTRTIKYLEENTAAAEMKLTEEEAREIGDAAHAAEIEGMRYPEWLMRSVFADTPEL